MIFFIIWYTVDFSFLTFLLVIRGILDALVPCPQQGLKMLFSVLFTNVLGDERTSQETVPEERLCTAWECLPTLFCRAPRPEHQK